MTDKVVKLNANVYTLDDVINDLSDLKDKIEGIIFITFLKTGEATVSHTGLPLHQAALACKLMDKEFDNLVTLEIEDNDV